MKRIVASLCLIVMTIAALFAETVSDRGVEGNPDLWIVSVVVPDVRQTTKEVPGDWIDAVDLAKTSKPDSYYSGFVLPHANAILTIHPSTIAALTKDVDEFIVDYENRTRAEFEAIPFDRLMVVAIAGNMARIDLRPDWAKKNLTTLSLSALEAVGNFKETGR